jgi:RNA polymerase sporulation-specific sigma factor
LILLSQQGDEQALEEILKRHRSVVRAMAGRFGVTSDEKEDLLQEGMIGLWKAVQAFRPSHGTGFVALARVCVRRQMLSALRKASVSLHLPPERVSAPSRWVFQEDLLSGMTPLERQAFAHYLAGESASDIAGGLSISTKMVDNALQRAKKKARRRLGLEEHAARQARRPGGLSTVGPA